MPESHAFGRELEAATAAAREAGATILEFYNQQSALVYEKLDGSVVTDADLAADAIIRKRISHAFPADPLLTEEGADDPKRLGSRRCWIVDPIDGTNQFVSRTGEFEVLIALVWDDRPVVGVVYQPTEDVLISAVTGNGATIEVNGDLALLHFAAIPPASAPRIMTSTWLGAPENLPLVNEVSAALGGGDALVSDIGVTVRRFIPPGDVAGVLIGVHPRTDSTFAWEWDFAAPDLVSWEAGGAATDLFGKLHRYNKPEPRNPGGIVMSVDPVTHRRVLEALATQREQVQPGSPV